MIPAHRRLATAVVALFAIAACGKDRRATDTTTAAGSIAPTTTAMQVADVDLGRTLGADKQVTDKTDHFKPSDTIYASVHTTGNGNGQLTARWTYQDGQVVDERSESITPTTGEARTEFHVAKPSGWPVGKYTLHVLLDGKEVQTKDLEVAK